MNKKNTIIIILATVISFTLSSCSDKKNQEINSDLKSKTPVYKKLNLQTHQEALQELIAGNKRFLADSMINTNHKEQIEQTKNGHQPHSVILSCMDSRVPPEIIFDQGIGNIFDIRNAGNLEDANVLGSIEYTVEHSTAKLIVVMGHSHCGAVTGAVNDIKHGHLTQLVEQIKPAIIEGETKKHTINNTAKNSIKNTINDILTRSVHINKDVKDKKIAIVGAFYDIETGIVTFLD